MNRREFLKCLAALGASAAFGKTSAYANWLTDEKRNGFPPGMLLIDAHAHPDQFYYLGPREGDAWLNWCSQNCDESSTLDQIMELRMNGSNFAAIGDTHNGPLLFEQVMTQIDHVTGLKKKGLVRIVRDSKDIPIPGEKFHKNFVPGAILSLEGASPLTSPVGAGGMVLSETLNRLFKKGVRMITVMHYLDNQFGQAMQSGREKTDGNGLTDLGVELVERMMDLGMVVDAAHAHFPTLVDIIEIAKENKIPIIDSHTSLSPCQEFCGGRLRTWEEMELVAKTGGLICTWPLKWKREDGSGRLTLKDWARENYKLKKRLGIEHIALGTDGGGVLPERVDGYESILDLPKLAKAMDHAGFKGEEIEAYIGGNFFRVLKKCIG